MASTSLLSYSIKPANPAGHYFDVTLIFSPTSDHPVNLTLPAWIPGSYMIRDFAKNIITLTAKDDSGLLSLTKQDKQSWQLIHNNKPVTLTWQVYAWDMSVRTAHLDDTHGFFNGTSVFLCPEGFESARCDVEILPPDHLKDWRVATGLKRAENTEKYSFGRYIAENYQQLIDCPVEMGTFESWEFEAHGIPHHLILTGKHYGDPERIVRELTKICDTQLTLFGKPYPMDEYWFLTFIVDDGFGGLEHTNSTALICSRYDLGNKNFPDEYSDGYKTFLSLCSHEYFHTWNVKRIKPTEFLPYQLDQEQ